MKALINTIVSQPEKRLNEILLILRLSVGTIFFQAGLGKFQHFDRTVQFFQKLGIPMADLNTFLASSTELVGGLLLIVGLFTRFAVLPMAFVMVIAITTAHAGEINGLSDLIRLQPWDYLLSFLILGAIGAGKWSLDSYRSSNS